MTASDPACDAAAASDSLAPTFLDLLPRLQTHARCAFRHVACADTRADRVGEVVALAWKWYVRLAERGKDVTQFVTAFVCLAARAVKSGRRATGQESGKDVLSPRARRRHGFTVTSLAAGTRAGQDDRYGRPHGRERQDAFEDCLRDDTRTPVPEQVAFRLDWPHFCSALPERDRRLAEFLALGHSATRAATRFGVSPGRVTQLRQAWCRAWRRFRGEASAATRPAREVCR